MNTNFNLMIVFMEVISDNVVGLFIVGVVAFFLLQKRLIA